MPKPSRFIFWTPRIFSIIFILFLALFSLDVLDSASSPAEVALGLFMHNIPSLVLLIVLAISWKHEIVGAITFFLAGILYIAFILSSLISEGNFQPYVISYPLIIAGPAFFIAALFLIGWRQKKK